MMRKLYWCLILLTVFSSITIFYNSNRIPFTSLITPFISAPPPSNTSDPIPRLAYFISGSAGEGPNLKRILGAIYHPRNVYLLHLDRGAPPAELQDLSSYIAGHALFSEVGNVKVVSKPNSISSLGASVVANVLHGAAVLLREGGDWDWFVNLSPTSYPLVTQDDLLYVLSEMPRNINFIDHQNATIEHHIVVDPGLYMLEKERITVGKDQREPPTAFKLFTGSPWMGLTRAFIEYCIFGWDNLPRTVLMYHANSISSAESYFQTIICNSEEFRSTTVNTDLHYRDKENLVKQTSPSVTGKSNMLNRYAPFAFKRLSWTPEALDHVDKNLLSRTPGMLVVPGGWCAGSQNRQSLGSFISTSDPCLQVGDRNKLQPGPGVKRLRHFLKQFVRNGSVLGSQSAVQDKLEV